MLVLLCHLGVSTARLTSRAEELECFRVQVGHCHVSSGQQQQGQVRGQVSQKHGQSGPQGGGSRFPPQLQVRQEQDGGRCSAGFQDRVDDCFFGGPAGIFVW